MFGRRVRTAVYATLVWAAIFIGIWVVNTVIPAGLAVLFTGHCPASICEPETLQYDHL